jgi:hypothetical protein
MQEMRLRELVRAAPGSSLEVDFKELAESHVDELIPALGEAIMARSGLESLTVTASELGEDAGRSLVEVVASSALTVFVLRADFLAAETVLALADAIANGVTLKDLTISGSFPEDDIGEALAKALASSISLRSLAIEGDLVGDGIGTALARALQLGSALQQLVLHGDLVGDCTGEALARALHNNITLRSLKLEGVAISDRTGRALANALGVNPTLAQLEVTGHCLGEDTGQAFSEALGQNAVLESLTIRALRGNYSVAASGCQALAISIMTNSTLRNLDIIASGTADANALADMLCANRSLRSLIVRGSFQDEDFAALAAALRENRSLEELHVHCSSLTKASAQALHMALCNNPSLVRCTIPLKDWPTAGVAAMLERNRDLPRCWRDLALLARSSEAPVVQQTVAAMTEQCFRRSVFAFLLPSSDRPGVEPRA